MNHNSLLFGHRAARFKGKVAVIITWDGFQDQEVIYPYHRLISEGYDVHITGTGKSSVTGLFGTSFPSVGSFGEFIRDHSPDLVILPGGVKALEKVRQDKEVIDFLREYKGVIGSICHGTQLLIEANLVDKKTVGGYYSIKTDVENAGGNFRDGVTIDLPLISTPHYKYMGAWMEEVLKVAETITPFCIE